MGRSRSVSPRKRYNRDRDRDRDREHKKHRRKRSRSRTKSRSKSRERHRHSSRDRKRERSHKRRKSQDSDCQLLVTPELPPEVPKCVITEEDVESKNPEEQLMMKMMGFSSFDSTKGKKVEGNDVGEVHTILKRKYRQYMNRKGGFNRPLDNIA